MKLNPLITVFLFGLYASVTLNAQTPQNPTNPFPNKKTNPPTSQPPQQQPSQTVPPVNSQQIPPSTQPKPSSTPKVPPVTSQQIPPSTQSPVSYTHLDVYKRQINHFVCFVMSRIPGRFIVGN